MNTYRLHIRPTGGRATKSSTFNYCLKYNIVGVGWRIISGINQQIEWAQYKQEAENKYKKISTVSYLKDNIKENDLIWTRDPVGQYYLANVLSPWEYFVTENSVNEDIDIANVVRVKFLKIQTDEVPGKVIASFRAPRTLQRICSTEVNEYSKYIWNTNTRTNHYVLDNSKITDIYTFLDSEELEDLLFVYLQTLGYIVIPNSRKADTMGYEYMLIKKDTKTKHLIQIKSGHTYLNIENYINRDDCFLLFQPYKLFKNIKLINENIKIIEPEVVKDFLIDSIDILPKVFKHKLRITDLV